MLKIFLVCLLIAIAAFSQTVTYPNGTVEVLMRYVPNSTTDVFTSGVRLTRIRLTNNTSSTVTCRIRDKSTNCNSGVCVIWADDVEIPARTTLLEELGGFTATGGLTWSCSAANSVVGSILGVQ